MCICSASSTGSHAPGVKSGPHVRCPDPFPPICSHVRFPPLPSPFTPSPNPPPPRTQWCSRANTYTSRSSAFRASPHLTTRQTPGHLQVTALTLSLPRSLARLPQADAGEGALPVGWPSPHHNTPYCVAPFACPPAGSSSPP